MPSLKSIVTAAFIMALPFTVSCPKHKIVHVDQMTEEVPVEINESAPDWFKKRKVQALDHLGVFGFNFFLKEYHPTVISNEKSKKLYRDNEEPIPVFFGYNTINETHFTAITYSDFDLDGTWKRKLDMWSRYDSSGDVDGEYCGYVRPGRNIIPLYIPLNTVPLTETVEFRQLSETFLSSGSLEPITTPVFTNEGDFFVNGTNLGSGLLCYSVSKQKNDGFLDSTEVPFEIGYTQSMLDSLKNIPSGLSPEGFVNEVTEKIRSNYSFEVSKYVETRLTDFYDSNNYSSEEDVENLPTFVLNGLRGRADCDVHNTTTIAIVRNLFDQPANIHRGEYCGDPMRCESIDKITHAYATIPDGNGYRIKFDTTGRRKTQ